MDYGAAPTEDTGWEVEINFGGYGKGGDAVLKNVGIHHAAPEHYHTVHCYTFTVRPV